MIRNSTLRCGILIEVGKAMCLKLDQSQTLWEQGLCTFLGGDDGGMFQIVGHVCTPKQLPAPLHRSD